MEQTQVVIVGAGPSGLALALSLAKFKVKSVILEKETEVTSDPRGVYLTGDAVRILHDLGIGPEMDNIGHEVQKVNFHRGTFSAKPFFTMNIGAPSILHQALPEGILQIQPRLENALRREIQRSEWCTLRTGCTVVGRSDDDLPTVEYVADDGSRRQIRGQFLIGADGKVGIVRKHFLEPTAGIKQEEGLYPYDGTWVAANLSITAPTPQTHPQFPLWDLGYSPDEVYDLFWPAGWHFCCPPGKATAAGRFGPHSERIWRHEFRQDWNDSLDAEELLWDHITPMITREGDEQGRKFHGSVQYPSDCIKILRCRPFRFTHKVVNRWFYKRTILIGDAAHVFPPFAGQGIASGVRDAHQLAWRLALLVSNGDSSKPHASSDDILKAWELERRKSVDDAGFFSMLNGKMCNNPPNLLILAVIWFRQFWESIPFLPRLSDPQASMERKGFTAVEGGFSLKAYNGGARLAQIYVQSPSEQTPILSDRLLHQSNGAFTVLVIGNSSNYERLYADAKAAIEATSFHPTVASKESIVVFTPEAGGSVTFKPMGDQDKDLVEVFAPALRSQLSGNIAADYNDGVYVDRLGRSTEFAIVRPDLFVFACAKNLNDLVQCLASLKKLVESS